MVSQHQQAKYPPRRNRISIVPKQQQAKIQAEVRVRKMKKVQRKKSRMTRKILMKV